MPTSGAAKKAPAKKAAARSGNPARRATTAPAPANASSVGAFKKASELAVVALPSGNAAKIRRVSITTLIAENLLGDELGALAQSAVDKGQNQITQMADEASQDLGKVAEMLQAFDRITVRSWAQPEVAPTFGILDPISGVWRMPRGAEVGSEISDADRSNDVLYVDELGLDDKMFTFNYVVGGDPDLATFREQFGQSVEGLPAGQGVGL